MAAAGSNKADLRIGDLYTADHQQYRVNAELDGDGTKPYEVKLYVDFVKGVLPTDSTSGAAWSGTLTLPESGKSILSLKSAGGERQKIKDIDVEDVVMTAERIERVGESDEVTRDQLCPLMNELVKGVLAVGARLAPIDRPGLVIDFGPVQGDVLAVALHRQLLKVGGEALQVLLIRQDGRGLRPKEISIPDPQ